MTENLRESEEVEGNEEGRIVKWEVVEESVEERDMVNALSLHLSGLCFNFNHSLVVITLVFCYVNVCLFVIS